MTVSVDSLNCFERKLQFWNIHFWGKRKTRKSEKTFRARIRTNNNKTKNQQQEKWHNCNQLLILLSRHVQYFTGLGLNQIDSCTISFVRVSLQKDKHAQLIKQESGALNGH